MRYSIFLLFRSVLLLVVPCLTAAGENEVATAPAIGLNSPTSQISWFEIDPAIRKYLILMTAVSMELNAELPDCGINPTPEQQFDMMQKIIERTPVDFLTGEAKAYITEANKLNLVIVEALRRESPKSRAEIMAVRDRFSPQIDALTAKYPSVGRYFTPQAQISISMMLARETDLQRVMLQAAMAGKSQKEAMRTAVEHLRYEAEQQF